LALLPGIDYQDGPQPFALLSPVASKVAETNAWDPKTLIKKRKRAAGIEPASSAWKAEVLPLNYARVSMNLSTFTWAGGRDHQRFFRICRMETSNRRPPWHAMRLFAE
jgi:hypothetical protein